ncbi:hypothetical protein [Halocatena halophila]|uniref:hypothetical protein n=1 Tax=Halocatena halophila TaxID=2814576 RepID=UPI002ED21A02
MTIRSRLASTSLLGTTGPGSKKHTVLLLVAVASGLLVVLRRRKSSSSESTGTNEDESEASRSIATTATADEDDADDESVVDVATGDSSRELDMFDMLAIVASAVTAARSEYKDRTGQ